MVYIVMLHLNAEENPTGDLERDLKQWVRKQIGPICYPM